MNEPHFLFVYGTLRPPQADTAAEDSRYFAAIAEHVRHHTPATLSGAALYNLGAYPAAIPGEGLLYGDLLQVDAAALPIADHIEGHPTFYRRQQVLVTTATGVATAWVYWAPQELTSGRPRITQGDWLRRPATVTAPPPPDQERVDPTLRTLVQRLADEPCAWLSSVRPDGRAHSAPIWHVWYQGRAYVVTPSHTVKAINIGENPSVVLTHPDPVNALILEGWATQANALRAALQPRFLQKYQWDLQSAPDYDLVIAITPTKLRAWGSYGEGRWQGEAVLQVW
ncbi:MAG: gamma-glutamylcyclotransferase [Caldilineaceae bacterium]|nr:gamma-glutamylcyclotransferase [Caldilineaceae bacterium]